jgi:NAD-dependent SIR2 family protein deacetylase
VTAARDPESDFERLVEIVRRGNATVLTGAGISTESGIPDYRGDTGRARPATPMTYQEFVGSAEARQRYWARSHLGWQRITGAAPNAGHRAVATLEQRGYVRGVITQNVDGLHQAAGATNVVELHGGLNRVRCLACGAESDRLEMQRRLSEANPGWPAGSADFSRIRPDGDLDLSADDIAAFRPVDCLVCGEGMLKPDVVFFGENVPAERVARCYAQVEASDALLVLGTSLTVASGFRFVKRAADRGIPICLVNKGETRGDRYAEVVMGEPLGETLEAVVESL